ncbi:MAG: AAA family ATPase [Janthinobacterium lividum]
MITRIEIDGFKSFSNFVMDFSPMTVVAGANASGKSNLFDALQLLSGLVQVDDLRNAFSKQRGDAYELFTQYDDQHYAKQMTFKVDMLVNRTVRDGWGREASLKYTRLHYELTIVRVTNVHGLEDLLVQHEELAAIRHDDDKRWIKTIPKATRQDWRPPTRGGRRGIGAPYIGIRELVDGSKAFVVSQDGNGGTGKREFPVTNATRTVLSGISSAEFPHALAAREEIRNWKFLQLNPELLREPTHHTMGMGGIRDTITRDGNNLAAALFRIKSTDSYALKLISHRLNNMLPSLTEVEVEDDQANKQYIIKVRSEGGRVFSSRVLSEGTLRLLALCVFQFDELHRGLLCFEEPENGIHPARLHEMTDLLLELSVDFTEAGTPLRQVIINTHSPGLVKAFMRSSKSKKRDLTVWFSLLTTRTREVAGQKIKLNVTKMLPVETTDTQGKLDFPLPAERKLAINQLLHYLDFDDTEKNRLELGLHLEEAVA